MKAKTLLGTLIAAGSLVAIIPAYAASCSVSSDATGHLGTAATGNVTLGGLGADGCDISGVNPQSGAHGDPSGFSDNFGSGWQLLSKVTGSSQTVTFGGVNYTIDFSSSGKSGTWDIKVNKPVTVDLVFAMHASNHSGAFFFDDQVLTAAAGGTAGTWAIKWLNNGGNIPDFSNLTIFARNQTITTAVPEADTYAMLLAGLGVVGVAARRRKQA